MADVELQQVHKSYDGQSLAVRDLSLHCPQGQMLALLGPSGCGKSSTLKMVAGLESVSAGQIRFDGVDVTALDSAARNVAMVFEDYSLYPHLSVAENIAFPLRVRGVDATQVRRQVDGVVDLLGLQALLNQPVRALSGGAQQRVSIGRALVREPALVMFDEPLSHLDADQKVLLRTEIRRLQATAGLTSVLVTHDQTEAMAMADRIAVMDGGVLQQVGSPQDLYKRPVNRFVATFIGESPMNLLPAQIEVGGGLRLGDRVCAPPPGSSPGSASIARWAAVPGPLTLGIRPEHIALSDPGETGAAALCLSVALLDLECAGEHDRLRLDSALGVLHAECASPTRLRPGEALSVWLPWLRLHAFATDSGVAL